MEPDELKVKLDEPKMEDIFAISGGDTSWAQNPTEAHRYTMDPTRAALGKKRKLAEEISFTDIDLVDITTSHHDPLVIILMFKRRNDDQVKLYFTRSICVSPDQEMH